MSATFIAHATWFSGPPPAFEPEALTRPWTVAAVVGAIAVALLWRSLGRRSPAPELRALQPFGRLAPHIPRLLAAHAGVSLLVLAFRGAFLAPSLNLPSTWWGYLLAILEALLGCWLVVGVRVRPAAWILVAAGPLGALGLGALPILERMDLLGVALFLALLPPDDAHPAGWVRVDPDRLRRALLGLRLLVGGALIVVAVTEKLARPAMTEGFLQDHPYLNLPQLLGVPVSDELFVQLAGGVEILIGLLIVSGALPQVAALAAAVPFTATLPFLGTDELLGHLPIYGVLLTLLVYGSRVDTAGACSWFPQRRPARTASTPRELVRR